ncbi:hypothetical protein yaldo0001_12730 [Yersinia aldovae ATCC 35236]|nr:hypothetical protein yaldo0001_12730 [Yersinia aldovae ATCC 35236]
MALVWLDEMILWLRQTQFGLLKASMVMPIILTIYSYG